MEIERELDHHYSHFMAPVLELQKIKNCLDLKRSYYSGIGIQELVFTTYKSL